MKRISSLTTASVAPQAAVVFSSGGTCLRRAHSSSASSNSQGKHQNSSSMTRKPTPSEMREARRTSMGSAMFKYLIRSNNSEFVKSDTPPNYPPKPREQTSNTKISEQRQQHMKPNHLHASQNRGPETMFERQEEDTYWARNSLRAQQEASNNTELFYSLKPADKARYIDMYGVKAPSSTSPTTSSSQNKQQSSVRPKKPMGTSVFTSTETLKKFELIAELKADLLFEERQRIEKDQTAAHQQNERRKEIAEIVRELSSLAQMMGDLKRSPRGEMGFDRERVTHDIYHRVSTLFGTITFSHFTAATPRQLINLARTCSTLQSPTAGPALLQAVQILQRIASVLTIKEVADVVISLAKANEELKGFGTYLDWFVEYLIGSNMVANSSLILTPGSKSKNQAPSSSSSSKNQQQSKQGANDNKRHSSNTTTSTSLTMQQISTLLRLMMVNEERFVSGHCQAFVQKVLQSHTADMISAAEKYANYKSQGSADESTLQQELLAAQERNADTLRLRLAVFAPACKKENFTSGGHHQQRGKSQEKEEEFVLERMDNRHMVNLCAAIAHYNVDSPEALDFIIAAAPLCIEAATLGDELSASDISHILLAFAMTGFRDVAFFIQIGEVVGKKAENLSDDDSARVLTAFSTIGIPHDSLRGAIDSATRMRGIKRGTIRLKKE